MTGMHTRKFKATIVKSGSRIFIPVPFDPNEAWGAKQKHYVSGTINGCIIRSLLGTGGNGYFVPLGAVWRRDAKLDAGARVEVVLTPEGPQRDNLAPDIMAALSTQPEARAFFESLATFYRRNYVRWIESAKRPETRAARIAEMMALLQAGKKQK